MDNATRVLSRDEVERVIGLVEGLDELSDVRGLTEALAIRSSPSFVLAHCQVLRKGCGEESHSRQLRSAGW